MVTLKLAKHRLTGADPGFPVAGAPTLQEGAPAYKFARFSEKTA